MTRIVWRMALIGVCIPAVVWMGGCGQDVTTETGTNSLTLEVVDLVGAQGSQLGADMIKKVDYGQKPPVWNFLDTAVPESPFSYSETVQQLPEGEFDLMVRAGSDKSGEVAQGKGQGCEMTFQLGRDESVTITITGLNDFGDKGYGPCSATVTRK